MKICHSETCSNILPESARYNQRFCCDDCYKKQNRIDANKRNVKMRKKRLLSKKICDLASCQKPFKISAMQHKKKFCSGACKERSKYERQKDKVGAPRKYTSQKTERIQKPEFTNPRGSKMRKKLGLPQIDLNINNGSCVPNGGM